MTSQQAMYYDAVRRLGERDEAFMDILGDGLTRQELATNIERRPSHWGRYAGFFRSLPSSPLEGENDQHRAIVDHMLCVIAENSLETLERHPTDVVVHDRRMLVQIAHPGANLLWFVNDSASHLFLLGVHPDETRMAKSRVTCRSDYVIRHIQIGETILFIPMTTKTASTLCDNAVPEYSASYTSRGTVEIEHHGQQIATMEILTCRKLMLVAITPEGTITPAERGAVQLWAGKIQAHYAGTVFAKGEITWRA